MTSACRRDASCVLQVGHAGLCSPTLWVQPINPENPRARFPCRGCSKLIDPKPPGCMVPRWYCGWECEEKAAKAGRNTETVDTIARTYEREKARGLDGEEWRWEESPPAVKRQAFACARGHQHASQANADACLAGVKP